MDIPEFFGCFVVNHIDLVFEDGNTNLLKEKLGGKYSVLMTTISLLEFVSRKKKNEKILKLLGELIEWSNHKF